MSISIRARLAATMIFLGTLLAVTTGFGLYGMSTINSSAEDVSRSLSKILCVRHNMSQRSMYATQTEDGRYGRKGIAINS